MQYFTFIGTGDYKVVDYQLRDDPNIYTTRFIQEVIVRKYYDDIEDVYIFCTEESKKVNGLTVQDLLTKQYQKQVHFLILEQSVSAESIIEQMEERLKDHFIFDVTHCFRSIPIVVTLVTNYLEVATGFKLKHLYYGSYETQQAMDLITEYDYSKLANELATFEKTLKVSADSLKQYNKGDKKIKELFRAFQRFNHVLEYCEFDASIQALKRVVDCSKQLLADKTQYILLIPYLNRIILKFSCFESEEPLAIKKISLIKLLMDHNLIQIAITFTDQLIRQELVHYGFFPELENYEDGKGLMEKIGSIYAASNYLFESYHIRNLSQQRKVYTDKKFESKKAKNVDFRILILQQKSSIITTFYNKVRNNINHGEAIDKDTDVKKIIFDCLAVMEQFVLYKRSD